MFTGIIETLGKVEKLEKEGGNLHITLSSNITSELKIDQSVSHNGVCLTVVAIKDNLYTVTAIEETLIKSNIGDLKTGDVVSLNNVTIEKGSITVDGVSLTVVDSKKDGFSVAIIPYTFEHTRFNTYIIGTSVNLEFDVVGKYVARLMELRQ